MEEITWLIRGLEEAPAGTRRWHIEALGRTANPAAAPPLCALLREAEHREAALHALEQLGETAVEPLCRELKYGRPDIHLHLIRLLGRIGDARATPLLCEALKEKDWRLRTGAFEALDAMGALSDPRAALPLLEIVAGPNWEAAERAAAALGDSGDARAVLPLVQALQDGHDAAGVALGKIALREPVPDLRTALAPLRQRAIILALEGYKKEAEAAIRTAIQRIEAATDVTNLPLPAAAPTAWAENLPLPAAAPAPALESLPLPSAGPASPCGSDPAAPYSLEPHSTKGARPWWQGLRHWLSGKE